MQAAKDTVVTIDYTMSDAQGKVLDSSAGKDPVPYLHGSGTLFPAMEKALDGKGPGETVKLSLTAEEAYGPRDEKLLMTVNKSAFQGGNVEVGMRFRTHAHGAQGHDAERIVCITAIDGDKVTVDGNHPFAGMPLTFEVTIKDVRAATPEEKAHGHVHGPGGHHHH